MTTLTRLLDQLPPLYTAAPDSTLAAFLEAFALEFETIAEDLDRLRRTHWINQAYRFEDATKLGALMGIEALPWETLDSYRARLLPLVAARIDGALAPGDIKQFVHDYLINASEALDSVLVPGLPVTVDDAFRSLPDRTKWHPLELAENPPRTNRSGALLARSGLVPTLFRWTETNAGLDDTVVSLQVCGLSERRTNVPVVVNLTTGDMILFAGRVPVGATLDIGPGGPGRQARGTLNGTDVTHRLHSLTGFTFGTPFSPSQYDPAPLRPRLTRGDNDWVFLSIGLYDVRGLNSVFFALADSALREVALDQTAFDHALFPSGPLASLAMSWTETEPASFEIRVPRMITIEPEGAAPGASAHERAADALQRAIDGLHAAGVRAAVRFMPFEETQQQTVRCMPPWIRLDPETGPSGISDRLDFGGRFGESGLGHARFE
jgi:hypothetical protein